MKQKATQTRSCDGHSHLPAAPALTLSPPPSPSIRSVILLVQKRLTGGFIVHNKARQLLPSAHPEGGRERAVACRDLINPNCSKNCKRSQDVFAAAFPVAPLLLQRKGEAACAASQQADTP